jgi:hypothetical protein
MINVIGLSIEIKPGAVQINYWIAARAPLAEDKPKDLLK